MMLKRKFSIVICVGHYRKAQGAVCPVTGISEWQINQFLVNRLSEFLIDDKFKVTVINDMSLTRKVKYINDLIPDISIDLHCDAFNRISDINTVLYWHESLLGKALAECICNAMTYTETDRGRGVENESGSYFCRATKSVSVLVESCFIDNFADFSQFVLSIEKAADCIRTGVLDFIYLINTGKLKY